LKNIGDDEYQEFGYEGEKEYEYQQHRKSNKYPPEYFDVLIFSDKTFLVSEHRADGECGEIFFYYFNSKETLFSSGYNLFRLGEKIRE